MIERQTFQNQDLVSRVSLNIDPAKFDNISKHSAKI
jgi:hypothetical protein